MTIIELLDIIRYEDYKTMLYLHVYINKKWFTLIFTHDQLETDKPLDIVSQAFPFCIDIIHNSVDVTYTETIKDYRIIQATSIVNIPSDKEKCIYDILTSNNDVEKNLFIAMKVASILFTYFHDSQIEEFNSIWNNMYTNWKSLGGIK